MNVDLFDFDLPAGRIAQHPVQPRDRARLLVDTGQIFADRIVRDLPALLRPGDILVCNDTRVIPTRLRGRRGLAHIEATLHKRVAADSWRAFVRPAKRLRPGDRIEFSPEFTANVSMKQPDGEVVLAFNVSASELDARIDAQGSMPLPPYIKRQQPEARDHGDYQTVFAARPGAVAAPTAGLHFTPELLAGLDAAGIHRVAVTLHVGAGTFLPVKTADTRDHVMHGEWGEIGPEAAGAIEAARRAGGRVVAVGTTALRLLETAAATDGRVRAFAGETDLFITPGYRFQAVDRLLTNFHLPRSTLYMLVCAFSGVERMQRAYRHAIDHGYRFYSYGDACLLTPSAHA
jgi:S-adenosylmethionine:tRNA ribosyltransferase-isomerase